MPDSAHEFDPDVFDTVGFASFQDLMPNRVHDILLVSSVYDSFILEEDGRLEEGMIDEYMDLNLVHLPRMLRTSTGSQALALAREKGFDLIITTMRLGDMHAIEFAKQVREAGLDIPVVLLTYDYSELKDVVRKHGTEDFAKVFLWQGDFRILLAIVKFIEDRLNVEADTKMVGVQSILVIEDNVRFYSAFLPLIYSELMRHSQNVLAEGVNQSHRIMRMRARPKLLLCETYEEAWEYFERYHDDILGVISDINFPRRGKKDKRAGIEFARNVRARHPDIPILLESSDASNAKYAESLGLSFVTKDSPLLLTEVRRFMVNELSFGDFVFRMQDGTEVDRAHDLVSLERCIREVPEESLLYHAERNHFSNWLKARTEFWLAHQLRPRRVSDYPSVEEIRADVAHRLREFRHAQSRGIVVDFDPETFDTEGGFARLGGGSLGGKGRGLAFVSKLIESCNLADRFEGVRIGVPPAVVIATDVFDRFLEDNDLRDFAINSEDDEEIRRRFIAGRFPRGVVTALKSLLESVKYPLAVRSSSLLEDSQHQPFAGIYRTLMLPNDSDDDRSRLRELLEAVKLVYASTFSHKAKVYMHATAYRLEEEKMAVVVQRLAGQAHGDRFYPDFSGVARSHNFYPSDPCKSDDGIAAVALGLGAFVVEGGTTLRFCPRYPKNLIQFSLVEDVLAYSQREFYALDLGREPDSDGALARFDLKAAEEDGVLSAMGSTYSPDNDAIYDGLSRKGVRLVTFAPILKDGVFPLPGILNLLLDVGRWSMSTSVEMEFAANHKVPPGKTRELSILQMRPMVVNQESEEVETSGIRKQRMIAESRQVLGNGIITGIHDIVTVDPESFDRAKTREVARDIALFNYELSREGIPYILFGVGRWGSADPWLGIPVLWEQIAGARVIVESSFLDMRVEPSQGSHFFQNLATMRVGYFTVDTDSGGGFVDWDWIRKQPSLKERPHARLIRCKEPLTVKMDGRNSHGVILKPAGSSTSSRSRRGSGR